MAGIADLLDAPPAFYQARFYVVSGTNWEVRANAVDGSGAPVAWSGCTASAKLWRGDPDRGGTVVKTITHVLSGGLQIDLSTAGVVVLRGTSACTFAASDFNRSLMFNLLITSTSPSLVLTPFQRCFIVPQANLN